MKLKRDKAFQSFTTYIDVLNNHRKFSFTLAEVLITLGIIGIVAALTLPTVINNTKNKQLETGLKRAYSLISQALNLYQAENGERLKQGDLQSLELKPILMKYLKNVKDCGYGYNDADKACIPSSTGNNFDPSNANASNKYKTYNGQDEISMQPFDDGQFVLNDGSLVLLDNAGSEFNLYISVDVNGYNKKPNRLGQDLFMFQINKKGDFLPLGAPGTTYYTKLDDYCSTASTNNMNGTTCTYKALIDKNFFKNLPK